METTDRSPLSGAHPLAPFNPPSITFAKRAARRLQRLCYTYSGVAVKLSAAQEALASAYGHESWFHLSRMIDREGYCPSMLDGELTEADVVERYRYQFTYLAIKLDINPVSALYLAPAARLSAAYEVPTGKGSEALDSSGAPGLPLAGHRPGISEILLTAYPFSLWGQFPLPGWDEYVVVAAPTDNTALWVRFCDVKQITTAAQQLVGTLKQLSDGALRLAHVPSGVVALAPGLAEALAAHAVVISGGRPAIMAARLRDRLGRVALHAAMELHKTEVLPTCEEMGALLYGSAGLVEIPDSKKAANGDCDLRPLSFARELIRHVREQRLAQFGVVPDEEKPAPQPWRPLVVNGDGEPNFRSGVKPIPKGAPVYRFKVELPLVDPDGDRELTIRRVIDVPVNYSLWDLHVAIQDAMGWSDYHLHEFTFFEGPAGKNAVSFASYDKDVDDPDEPCTANEDLDKHIVALSQRPARYLYDFGDMWKHWLTLVATVASDGGGYPRCISGERACPPEDCGSDGGYFEVLDVMAGGERARDHDTSRKEMTEWLKGHVNVDWPYRPDHFDPAAVRFDDPVERWEYAYLS